MNGLDHEIYELGMMRIKDILQDACKGEVTITKDDRNFYVTIYRFGYYWNYRIDNVDLMDVNYISWKSLADDVLQRYTIFVIDSYFYPKEFRKYS